MARVESKTDSGRSSCSSSFVVLSVIANDLFLLLLTVMLLLTVITTCPNDGAKGEIGHAGAELRRPLHTAPVNGAHDIRVAAVRNRRNCWRGVVASCSSRFHSGRCSALLAPVAPALALSLRSLLRSARSHSGCYCTGALAPVAALLAPVALRIDSGQMFIRLLSNIVPVSSRASVHLSIVSLLVFLSSLYYYCSHNIHMHLPTRRQWHRQE